MKTGKEKLWRKAAAGVVVLAFVLSACGAGSASESSSARQSANSAGAPKASSFAEEESYDEGGWEESYETESSSDAVDLEDVPMGMAPAADYSDDTTEASGSSEEGEPAADLKSSNRKIVYTGSISLQTLEYDQSAKSIHEKINACGGFVESEDTYNEDPYWYYTDRSGSAANRTRRNLSITARIPADQFDSFMKDLENDGQVTNTSVNARNISVSYATHDASRKALEIEKERLLKMMDKAETVEEMIAVEQRLTEVERELGEEMTELSAMDRDVDFSTVYISLQEVFEYSEQVVEVTYGERLRRAFGRAIDGFVTFWEDLLLFVVETFPFLIMLAVIIALIVRFLRRRRARKKEERSSAAASEESGPVEGRDIGG